MRGRLSLLGVLGALLLGLFGFDASDVRANERAIRGSAGVSAVATFAPDPVDFGDVVIGETKRIDLKFTYTGNTQAVFRYSTGPNRGAYYGVDNGFDATDTISCRNTLMSAGDFCTMRMFFTVLAAGVVTDTLTLVDDTRSGATPSVTLRGNGVSATPATTLSVAAARGPYRGEVALSATLMGCVGSVADRAVALTITTDKGRRTVAATTNASGVAIATAVPLTIATGGVAAAIPAGDYAPSAGWGVSASFVGGEGCAAGGGTAALTVERRAPALTFAAPATTTYGAAPFALTVGSSAADDVAAPSLQLSYAPSGVCSGPATPPATVTILGAGDCTITLGQPAGDNANYVDAAPVARTVTIARASPALAWDTPGAIVYGTPLGSAQLRATASFGGSALPGSFGYTPGFDSVLLAGSHTLAVTFTPTDTANYTGAQTSVALTVTRATPVVTWSAPGSIAYGTPLGAAQLAARATVAGQFTYGQAMGTMLGTGTHELTALFTPTDSANYTTATGATTLKVERAPLTVTANAASRAYGADDPPFVVTYEGFVNGEGAEVLTGTLACASDATRLSPVGTGYRIDCSGRAAANYTLDARPGVLTITQAGSALTLADARAMYGAATLDVAATLTAPAPLDANAATFAIMRDDLTLRSVVATGISGSTVSGTLSLAGLPAGDYTLVVRYAGDRNVAPSEGRAGLQIAKASQAIIFAPPAAVPLAGGAVQLSASASSGLTVTLTIASAATCTVSGSVLTPRRAGDCTITAAQDGDADHDAAQSVSRTIQITAPPPTATATATATVTTTATPPTSTPTATPTAPPPTSTATATATATPPTAPPPIATPPAPPATPVPSGTPIPTPSGTPTPSPMPAPAQYTLTLTVNTGGSVSASVPGPRYPAGTRLTLRAAPDADALFVGWTVDGVAQGWSPTLTVTLRVDRRVEARFAPRPAFGDLAPDARTNDPIAQLAARGIIKGYGDGSYGPADPILRAQMAALIVRALGWDGAAGGPTPFDDRDGVDAELWRAIGQLATRGIARGYGDGTYRPRDPVLHIQAISFVTRALIAARAWQAQPDDPRLFPEVTAASGHRTDLVTYLHYVGTLPGLAPGATWAGPDGWEGPATRAWFAELLWRALDETGRGEREV